MPPARFVRPTPEEDARLRAVEQDPLLKPKVRLRAQVLRLSGRGQNVGSTAAYTGRSEASVLRGLDRWEERGFGGLADCTAPGNPPRITGEVRAFMEEKLSEERTWNASQLAEAVADRFGVFSETELPLLACRNLAKRDSLKLNSLGPWSQYPLRSRDPLSLPGMAHPWLRDT